MTRMAMAEVHRSVAAALQAANTSVTNAESVATAVIAAEASGDVECGIRLVPDYCELAIRGRIDGYAVPSIAQSAPGALIVDAGHGFAYPALDLAIEELPAIAAEQGIAMAGLRRSHHCGYPGGTAERLADMGFVAMVLANVPAIRGSPVDEAGAIGGVPLAFGIPLEEGTSVVADFPGLVTDGSQMPIGLIADFLAAGLTGANYSSEAPPFFSAEGPPPGVGQLLVAIAPGAFGGDAVLRRYTRFAASLADRDDTGDLGRERKARRAAALRDGLAVSQELRDRLSAIARTV